MSTIALSLSLVLELGAVVPGETPTPITSPTAASPAAGAPAEGKGHVLRLAVYEMKVDGIDERVGRVVTDAVVAEVRKLQRVSVVSMDEVKAMLDHEAQKQLTGCADDSCIAEIADSLGVDGIIIGTLAKIGDDHVFGLRRIDQRAAASLGQVSQRLQAGNGEEFLAMVGPAIEQLFPEPAHALRAGQKRGVSEEVALRISPPPLPTWVFWTTTASAGVLGVAAGAALTVNLVLFEQVNTRERQALEAPQPGKEVVDIRAQNDLAATSTIALGSAAVLATAGAGVVAMFTDWDNLAAE